LNPRRFFRNVSRRGNFAGPFVFALICAVISGVVGGMGSFVVTLISGDVVGAVIGLISSFLVTSIIGLVSVFVGAGVLHLLVLLFARSRNAGFEATFRVAAYVSAIRLITWVATVSPPGTIFSLIAVVIALITGIYGLYIAYFGIRELHATTDQRAPAVVALPILAVIFLSIFFSVAIATLLSMGQ